MSVYSIDELRSIIADIAGQYGVKKVALFGSYSTGLQTPESDIDLLIDKGSLKMAQKSKKRQKQHSPIWECCFVSGVQNIKRDAFYQN